MISNTPANLESLQPSATVDVEVNTVPVELYKILKFEGLVGSGAEAKAVVADGLVRVNDVVEIQKRKKIVAGDIVEFAGQRLRIVFSGAGS